MRARRTFLAVAIATLIGSASFVGAAGNRIEGPARVNDSAERVAVPAEVPVTAEQRAAIDMIALINADRADRGLPSLAIHHQVMSAAEAHAADMAAMRSMQHAGSDGSNAGDRLEHFGFTWRAWGENIGAGFTDPAALLAGWLGSPPHRRNLLGSYEYVGVGVVTGDGVPYWALVLAND